MHDLDLRQIERNIIERIDAGQRSLGREIEQLRQTTTAGFDKVNGRLREVEEKTIRHDERLSTVDREARDAKSASRSVHTIARAPEHTVGWISARDIYAASIGAGLVWGGVKAVLELIELFRRAGS